MRITRSGDHIVLRDRPGLYWALGIFLLAGGVVTIAMALGLATNAADLSASERRAITVVGVGGPAMRLRSGELVLLSELWTHDQAGVAEGVREFATVCHVPWDGPPGSSMGVR